MTTKDRDAYRQKREDEIRKMEAEIMKLRTKADKDKSDMKARWREGVDRFEKGVSDLNMQLDKLGQATEDNWENLRMGFENNMERLRNSVDAARREWGAAR